MIAQRAHIPRRASIVGVAIAIGVAVATPCMAQSPGDKALAEGLFREARELMKENRTAEACGKFQESHRLDPTLGTLLNLAVCHETLGHTASAWAEFNEALRLAERRGDTEREKIARERVRALEAVLSRVTIVAHERTAGLEVRAGDRVIGAAVLGSPLPFDPGQLRIVASAKGHSEWTKTVDVPPGPASVTVEIPPLVAVAESPKVAQKSAEPPPAASSGGGSGTRTLGWIALGIGAVGLGAGTYFGLDTFSKRDKGDALCTPDRLCTQEGLDLQDEAHTSATISTIGFVAGGVALAAGAVLLIVGGSRTSAATIRPSVGLTGTGLGGRW